MYAWSRCGYYLFTIGFASKEELCLVSAFYYTDFKWRFSKGSSSRTLPVHELNEFPRARESPLCVGHLTYFWRAISKMARVHVVMPLFLRGLKCTTTKHNDGFPRDWPSLAKLLTEGGFQSSCVVWSRPALWWCNKSMKSMQDRLWEALFECRHAVVIDPLFSQVAAKKWGNIKT